MIYLFFDCWLSFPQYTNLCSPLRWSVCISCAFHVLNCVHTCTWRVLDTVAYIDTKSKSMVCKNEKWASVFNIQTDLSEAISPCLLQWIFPISRWELEYEWKEMSIPPFLYLVCSRLQIAIVFYNFYSIPFTFSTIYMESALNGNTNTNEYKQVNKTRT